MDVTKDWEEEDGKDEQPRGWSKPVHMRQRVDAVIRLPEDSGPEIASHPGPDKDGSRVGDQEVSLAGRVTNF